MTSTTTADTKLENFDDLFTGDPKNIEQDLLNLLPRAKTREDKSIYLQILSQIALAQAMQQKFDQAHQTLDSANKEHSDQYPLAHVRILLERGRIFHQSNHVDAALPFFVESYELSKKNGFDFHTVNAAHMIAIATQNVDEKISWNKTAIDLATTTNDERCSKWLGPLHNNLAQNYIEAKQYEQALFEFKQTKIFFEKQGDANGMRGADWGIARCLRSLGSLDEALAMQLELLTHYDALAKNSTLPVELIAATRGFVYEELAEIHLALTKKYSGQAYDDLSKNAWCKRLLPERLERMKRLYENLT